MKLHHYLALPGKTATALSAESGVALSVLSRLSAGRVFATPETIDKIRRATHRAVTADDLVDSRLEFLAREAAGSTTEQGDENGAIK